MVTGLAVEIVFVKENELREGLKPGVPTQGQARPRGLRSALLQGLSNPGRACSGASGDQGGGLDRLQGQGGAVELAQGRRRDVFLTVEGSTLASPGQR